MKCTCCFYCTIIANWDRNMTCKYWYIIQTEAILCTALPTCQWHVIVPHENVNTSIACITLIHCSSNWEARQMHRALEILLSKAGLKHQFPPLPLVQFYIRPNKTHPVVPVTIHWNCSVTCLFCRHCQVGWQHLQNRSWIYINVVLICKLSTYFCNKYIVIFIIMHIASQIGGQG